MGLLSHLFGKSSKSIKTTPSQKSNADMRNVLNEQRELERQQLRQKRIEYERNKTIEFENELNSIPEYEITKSDFAKLKYPEDYEFKFSSVTAKTSLDKIGNFVVIDTETTGLKRSSSVLELSGIKYEHFQPIEKFETLVRPTKETSWEEAQKINGISPEMVADAPTINEVAMSFIEFCADYNFVGHNLEYDLKILEHKGICFSTKRKFFDTLQLAKKVWKTPKKKWDRDSEQYEIDYDGDYDVLDYRLETLCSEIKVFRNDAHRSDSDCLATAKIFEYLVRMITL